MRNALENNKYTEDAIITQNGKADEDKMDLLPYTELAKHGDKQYNL
jgi:hypothetical protein